MTALLDFPTMTPDPRDPFTGHTADAGHFDTRPASARVPFAVSLQLPAHYLAAALYLSGVRAEELATAQDVREAVAIQLMVCSFNEIEDAAVELAADRLGPQEVAGLEFCRVKIAEAFAPCDPWATTGVPRPAAAPLARIPYACDPS